MNKRIELTIEKVKLENQVKACSCENNRVCKNKPNCDMLYERISDIESELLQIALQVKQTIKS